MYTPGLWRMPPAARHPALNELLVGQRRWGVLPRVSQEVAVAARCGDVPTHITSTVEPGNQMFCCALKGPREPSLQSKRSQFGRVVDPHGHTAITAASILVAIRAGSIRGQSVHGLDSRKRDGLFPAPPLEDLGHLLPWAMQAQHRWLNPTGVRFIPHKSEGCQ